MIELTKRELLKSVSATAIAVGVLGFMPHGIPPSNPTQAWMEAPDIMAIQVSDVQPRYGNIFDTGSTQSASYEVWTAVSNPRDGGATENALIIGSTKQNWKFNDLPSAGFIDRLAMRVPANYTISNGITVTDVYFRQEANSQVGQGGSGGTGAGALLSVSQTITVYLKLSSTLSNNVTYNISHSTNQFPAFTLTYNDKVTRAGAIRVSVGGHKPNDPIKLAYLCSRIPGNPTGGDPGTHGSIDFGSTYGVSSFNLIDNTGAVVFTGAAVKRLDVTDPEKISAFTGFIDDGTGGGSPSGVAGTKLTVTAISDGYLVNPNSVLGAGVTAGTAITSQASGTTGGVGVYNVNTSQLVNPAEAMYVPDAYPVGVDLADTSQSWTITGIIANSNPVQLVFAGGHAFSTGDKIRCRGISGPATQLEGSPGTAHLWIAQQVTVIDANNLTIPLNSTGWPALTTTTYQNGLALGGYQNQAYKCFNTNRAGCTVYGLDYSAFTTPGIYRIYIPGFGVSDPIPIAQTQFATNCSLHHMGVYNQRQGIALDGRANFTRGVCLRDGVSPTNNYWSVVPALWSVECASFAPATGDRFNGGCGAFLVPQAGNVGLGTTTQAVGSYPPYQDASDYDGTLKDHASGFAGLAFCFEVILKNIGAASCQTPFQVPLSSQVCDPTIFAGTDGAAPLYHEMVWFAEAYRTQQNTNPADTVHYGSVPGGFGIGHFNGQIPDNGEPISYYRGTDPNGVTNGGICGAYLYAADHLSGLEMVQFFAKLAIISYEYGFGTVGDTYKNAATLLLNWCEGIFGSTTVQNNYYITTLNLLSNLTAQFPSYGMTQYNNDLSLSVSNGINFKYNTLRPSVFGTMWRLSGMNSSGTYPAAGAPTPDFATYGSVADAAFNTINGQQGGWDYLECSAYPSYNATHAANIKAHWDDSIGGQSLGPNSISTKTSFASNQYSGLGGVYPNGSCVTQHVLEVVFGSGGATSNNLKALLANFGFQYGANLRGMQFCCGQAPRGKLLIDDIDSWRLGNVGSRTGLTSFVFQTGGWNGGTQNASNNFALGVNADASSVYCALNTTGNNEASPIFGSKKVEEPWPQGQAVWEWTPSNWVLTNICEFTLVQLLNICSCALWAHAWDGSHI